MTSLLTFKGAAFILGLYLVGLCIYRLTLHPLARFPGPKLAAVTRYYEAYYDVICGGKYVFKLVELHQKYGPIVRISPYELHFIDPAYLDTVYRQDGRWDKDAWAYDAFLAPGATICTPDHYVHKARRIPLSPFFSKAKVAGRQDLIRRHAENLSRCLATFPESGALMDLSAATSAFTKNVATEFILDKSFNNLDRDFTADPNANPSSMGHLWRITKHIPWYGPIMRKIPSGWLSKTKTVNEATARHLDYIKQSMEDTKNLMADAKESEAGATPSTIVHAILDSKLSESDKNFGRVWMDVATVAGAGVDTTASVLRLVIHHVFSNPEVLGKLRAELTPVFQAATDSEGPELRRLEQLPYLTAVLKEGLRLSPAISARMARVAPDRDLFYGDRRIPAGTPVGTTALLLHTWDGLYANPMSFEPARWLESPGDLRRDDRAFLPFSKGTRNCLGMQ